MSGKGEIQERHAAARWIGIILALLGGNAVAVVILLVKAGPADASRVYPDYYQRAAAWDQTMERAQRAADLGWRATMTILRDGRAAVRLVDAHGQPVVGATVAISGFHRGHAARPFAGTLSAQAAGTYVGEVLPWPPPGLANVTVTASAPDSSALFTREAVVAIGESGGAE